MNLHEVYLAAQIATKGGDSEVKSQTALNRSTLGYQRKNQLLNKCVSKTMNGVTATVNADSSITLSGSNTLGSAFVFYRNLQTGLDNQYTDNRKWLANGEYIVSGSAVGADIQVRMSADNTSEGTGIASKNGAENKFTVTDDDKYVWTRILIASAADFGSDGVTIYPMIRSADIADNTYEPYKPSIDERLAALESILASQTMSSAVQNLTGIPKEETI